VEVHDDEKTFVLETGSEVSGKSYIKFDKQAIYQTDAVVEKSDKKTESQESETVAQQTTIDEITDTTETTETTENKEVSDDNKAE
jgi:hypothetical protein